MATVDTQLESQEATAWLPAALPIVLPLAAPAPDRAVSVLGVTIQNLSMPEAVAVASNLLVTSRDQASSIYFVNAHTLNLAYENRGYRDVLNRATYVLGDGTGVRWGARMQGIQLRANLNGTDFVPTFLRSTENRGHTYYLLGSTPPGVERAAEAMPKLFPGWRFVGCHHGFDDAETNRATIAEINRLRPDLLLVGMGNPYQEQWIHRHRHQLNVRLCMGVGALFAFLSGDVKRAPMWMRRAGCEWVQILFRQRHKWARYVLGNPKYLWRIARAKMLDPA